MQMMHWGWWDPWDGNDSREEGKDNEGKGKDERRAVVTLRGMTLNLFG
jgi:hypothetical protein